MGDFSDILCTVIVFTILVFGSVFEENTLPPSQAQVSTTLTIIATTNNFSDDIFAFTVTGPSSYNTSIYTAGGMGVDGPTIVTPGDYSINEIIPIGWNMEDIFCNDGISMFDGIDTINGIHINSGDDIVCHFANNLLSTDFDGDGIDNIIDTIRDTYSDDFSDISIGGTSFGTITTRENHILYISEETNPSGLKIMSDLPGIEPAATSICNGIATIDFDIADQVVVTCGSATIDVIYGAVDITFIGSGGTQATTTVTVGNSITFDQDTFSFSAPVTNTQTIIINFEGTFVTLEAGSTQSLGTLKITKLTTGGDDTFDFTVTGSTSSNPSINTASGGATTYLDTLTLFNSLNDFGSSDSFGQLMTFTTPQSISSIRFHTDTSEMSSGDGGALQGVIYSGVSAGSPSFTQIGTSVETFQTPWDDDGAGGTFIDADPHDVMFTFDPPVTVSSSGIFVGVKITPFLSEDLGFFVSSVNLGGDEGLCVSLNPNVSPNFEDYTSGLSDCTINSADIVMKIGTIAVSGGMGIDGPTLVIPGTYSIQETVTTGWSLTDATCNDGSSSFIVDTVSGIDVAPGDNIECTFENAFAVSTPDDDSDGIFNGVDTLPNTYSDDFSDIALGGTSSGAITVRGDQILAISEELNPAGVRIADISGGTTPATVSVCGGISTINLTAGDEIVVTCGSVIVKTISGAVEVVLIASDGTQASTSIPIGNEITFDPLTSTINANPDNSDTIVIMIGDTLVPLSPGSSDFSDIEPPEITINSLINDEDSFNFGNVPPAPTCTAQDDLSGVAGGCSVIGYQTGVGTHQIQFSASDLAGNTNTITLDYHVLPWSILGFYPPVDMSGVVNTVKGGSTVPMKFEVFAGSIEKTSTSDISSFTQNTISCSALTGNPEDAVEITTTDLTGLKYTSGQFHANWKTPKSPNTCWEVKVTTNDGSSLSAFFKLK